MHLSCHEIKRWRSFSAMNASQTKESSPTIRLNIPMPCPPRGTVPVNQGRGLAGLFQSSTPGSLLVRNATAPAMSARVVRVATNVVKSVFLRLLMKLDKWEHAISLVWWTWLKPLNRCCAFLFGFTAWRLCCRVPPPVPRRNTDSGGLSLAIGVKRRATE